MNDTQYNIFILFYFLFYHVITARAQAVTKIKKFAYRDQQITNGTQLRKMKNGNTTHNEDETTEIHACVYVFCEVNGSSIVEIGEEMVTREVYEIYKSIRSQSEWRDEEWFKRTLDITLKDLQTWVKKLFKQVELLKKLKPIS